MGLAYCQPEKDEEDVAALNTPAITDRDQEILQQTWNRLSSRLSGIGVKVFLRIFELAPSAKEAFQFGKLSEEELLSNGLFRSHATRFMQAVEVTVNNLDVLDVIIVPNLVSLGRRHLTIPGFRPEYLKTFETAMMDVWSEELGKKYFCKNAQIAWQKVFHLIANSLQEGYRSGVKETVWT